MGLGGRSVRARLLRSHLLIALTAAAGLLAALLAIRMLLGDARGVADSGLPRLAMCRRIADGVARTQSLARGGGDAAERRAVWEAAIWPSLERLDVLAPDASGPGTRPPLGEVRALLRELESLQAAATARADADGRERVLLDRIGEYADAERARVAAAMGSIDVISVRGMGICAAFMSLLLLAALIAARSVTQSVTLPVEELCDATEALAAGVDTGALMVSDDDEIGRLTHAFNRLRAAFKRGQAALRRAGAELERRVAARARQLDEARDAKLKDALALAQEAASRGAAARSSDFLADAGEELRAPLHCVVGATDLLLDTALSADQRELAGEAGASARELLARIDDLLVLAQIESGRLEIDQVRFDLHDVLGPLLVGGAARVDAGVPRDLSGDAARLRHLLRALLALGGDASLAVTCDERDGRSCLLRFAVPAGAAASDTANGKAGASLALCRRLAESMGGGAGAAGAVLWCTARFGLAAERPEADESRPGGARVLLVEDDAVDRRVGLKVLRQLGCDVRVAASGTAALDEIGAQPFDLVLMDCGLPELDGLEAARRVRARADDRRAVPILALTASAAKGDRERCIEAGMNDQLVKPLAAAELRAAIERHVPRFRRVGPLVSVRRAAPDRGTT